MGRVNFIVHGGRRILHLDFSRCSKAELQKVMGEAKQTIAREPRNSVRTLSDFTEVAADNSFTNGLAEFAKHNKPYVRAAALVGIKGVSRLILSAVRLISKRDLRVFDTVEEAKDWLAAIED